MEDRLKDIEKFFKYNLEIKNILHKTVPKDEYRYNREALIEYSDKLFLSLNDIEYYLNVILEKFNYSNEDKMYLKNFINILKEELINCGYDFNKLKTFYNVCFANMSESLINKVATNCIGYYGGSVSIKDAKSLNEFLHIIHKTIVNREGILKSLPKIENKKNDENYDITLYGRENEVALNLFIAFPKDIICGDVEIVSLEKDRIIMMIRDRGHALSIEIEKEAGKYYVKYFIPKICNVDMVNRLKGVTKITDDDMYAVGLFETTADRLPYEVADFISKVPTDYDLFIEGGKLFKDELQR